MSKQTSCTCNSGCQNCNNGCQSCEKGACETVCLVNQYVSSVPDIGSFSFSSCVKSGETIRLTASDWNNLIAHIEKAYNYGNKGKNPVPAMTAAESGQLIYKTTYNQVASALNLGSSDFPSLPSDEAHPVIYGKYFSDIEDYTKTKFQFAGTQCFGCNQCQFCNGACEYCNSGCQPSCNSGNTTCEDKPSGKK